MVRLFLIAAALLAAALPARAQDEPPYDPVEWFGSAIDGFGTWTLTLDIEDSRPEQCRIELSPRIEGHHFVLTLAPNCVAQFPPLAGVVGWTAINSSLDFVDKDGAKRISLVHRGPGWIIGGPTDGPLVKYNLGQHMPDDIRAAAGTYTATGAGWTCPLILGPGNARLTPGATEPAYGVIKMNGCETVKALTSVEAWLIRDGAIVLLTSDTKRLASLRRNASGDPTGRLPDTDITLTAHQPL